MTNDIRKIVKEGYEQGDYAGHFRVSSDPNEMEKKYLDRLAALLPKAAKILDLGCGIGVPFDRYLVEKGFRVTGIDFAANHIKAAKKNVPKATFIEGDFSKTDFGGEHFHAIIAFYSIFHIPREEQQDLFKRMNELLEDGGLILVTLGTSGGDGVEENWVGSKMAWSNYDPATYKAMIAQAGFEVTESEYEGQPGDDEYHWWVLAKKK
jgi:2-polyprenyl-3-methyl-5-hydroxy-6-metoxy-1,4-benzoquinol methylase